MAWYSLPLGLVAWVLPLWAKKKKLPHKGRWALASCLACGMALMNVLWELLGRAQSGDYAALLDITDNLAVCSILLVLGTAVFNGRLLAATMQPLSGRQKFLLVAGLQVLIVGFCALGRAFVGLLDGFLNALYPLLLLLVGQSVYIYTLQKTPKERVSWGIPLGMAVFPLLYLLMLDRQTEQLLLSTYYVPCQMTTLMSTAILKYQNRKKGAA